MDEEAHFLQRFRRLYSSFNLKIQDDSKSKEKNYTRKRVQLKYAGDEFDSNTERTRTYNLLSFLQWEAGERENAQELNRKVLELQNKNIVALCNRVWMIREDGRLTEADKKLTEVEKLVKCNQDLLFQGKAELAYSYSAFGPFCFSQSVDMYTQLLEETANKEIDTEDLQLWKLDLGLIYRKYCNSGSILPKEDWKERNKDDYIKKAALLFTEVASANCPVRWKGRCLASLAELSFSIYTGIQVTKSQLELFPKEYADKDVETLLNLALEACMEDSHVLKVCGKYFKYLRKFDKAEELLRKSLSIRKNSFSHHHLALVLKKKLKFRIYEERKNRDRRNHENENRPKEYENCYDKKSPDNEILPTEEIIYRTSSNPSTHNQVERSDHYTCKISKTNVEIRSSKKNSQNNTSEMGRIEEGVVPADPIPNSEKEAVTEILYHLDKAIEFGNEWAAVEKGIVLRQIKEHKRAFESFLWTLNMKQLGTTMITVSCYEHLGACCRDIAKDEVNPEEKKTLEADAIKYFRKAIETIAYKASKELDFLKDVSMAYPTLKHMFQSQNGGIKTLKELVEVSKMLEKYGETLEFYEQIKALDEEQLKDPAIIRGEIEILLAKREFDQAAVLLDLQNCTKVKDEINKEFCMLVYLECAFHLINDKINQNAHRRFRQAFDIYGTEINREKTEFDIFFLYEEDIETNETQSLSLAFTLAKKLENFVPGNLV
ncbi:hypothetical protein CHS0354_035434 [Potamilus streckersoni]|uniref:Uncharacterized protein n=1 Tax=Potamilus streckersoni TaxID=2493646 RepID=A0AAE0TEI0_9BIVA|nr:hypothetical protein CHS0354_035434 [Potamilus streckersoni]